MTANGSGTDTIDLADILRSVRQGWRIIASSIVVGLAVALLVLLFAPRRFDGAASAVVRTTPDAGTSLLSRVGDASGGAAALLGGAMTTPIETEIQILSSRAVAEKVLDSLLLQVHPREPSVPATALVRAARLPGGFKKLDVSFERAAAGTYRVRADGVDTAVAAGGDVRLPVGSLSLQKELPPSFRLRLYDREEAITRTMKNLNVTKLGGEVVRVAYRASDSITASSVPNAVVANYLVRRRTVDRGTNSHRVEFLTAQIDSTATQLAAAEQALRAFQESSGVVDAPLIGKLALEQAAGLRKDVGALEVETGALGQLLAQVGSGKMSARQLAAYPSFLKSPGINELLKQLSELETERTRLLERRLETDDEVVALTRSINNVEAQLVPLGRAYSNALEQQKRDVQGQLGTLTSALGSFPGASQESARRLRDVMRLSQLSIALQGQLAQARLSAINEGGDVRPLDVAVPPAKPSFPRPVMVSALGLGAGVVIGMLLALLSGSHGRYFEGPHAIERALGVPALRFDAQAPLLMSGRGVLSTVLLVPLEAGVPTAGVAERLVGTALARGETATVLDLTEPHAVSRNGSSVGSLLGRLEQEHAMVVVRLPSLSSDSTAAVLNSNRTVLFVVPAQRVNRVALMGAVETLRRLDIPCAGVVLSAASPAGVLAG